MAVPLHYLMTAEELGLLTRQTATTVLQAFPTDERVTLFPGTVALAPHAVRRYLEARGVSYAPRIIAHINLKGGTGKTTSVISAATRAIQYGFKTCIIDMDSQASASLAFDILLDNDDPIFCDVWQRPHDMVMDALHQIDDSLWILPSSLENGLLDVQLMNPASQKHAVRGVCEELRHHDIDLILLDCPPSLGTAVISTICAADTIVIPVCGDAFSRKGLELTIQEIASICDTFSLPPPVIRILYTKYDKRLRLSGQAFEQLRDSYPDRMIPTPIRTSSEFSKALERSATVFASTKKNHARKDYDAYVRNLLALDPALQGRGALTKGDPHV